MPKNLTYTEVVARLKKHDKSFELYIRKGKGSHRTLYHPNVNGRAESYPLKYHGDKTNIGPGHLNAMIRRFKLPRDIFDK